MPAVDPVQRKRSASHAADTRWNKQDPAVLDRRRAFKTDQLAKHIKSVVASAPRLTAEQRDRLAVLLRGEGAP